MIYFRFILRGISFPASSKIINPGVCFVVILNKNWDSLGFLILSVIP